MYEGKGDVKEYLSEKQIYLKRLDTISLINKNLYLK